MRTYQIFLAAIGFIRVPTLAATQEPPRNGLSAVVVAGISGIESIGIGLEAWRRVVMMTRTALRIEAAGFTMKPPNVAVACVSDPCEYRQVRRGAMISAAAEQTVSRNETQPVTLLASGGLIAPYTRGAYLKNGRWIEHARRVALQASAGVSFGNLQWRGECRWRVAPGIISHHVAFLTFSVARTF